MGWCQAFGPQIQEGCDHSMVAGSTSCSCPECGVVCPGRFAGCGTVWAAGPQHVEVRRPRTDRGPQHPGELAAATNGHRPRELSTDVPMALPVSTSGPGPASTPVPTGPVAGTTSEDNADNADLRSLVLGLQTAIDALPRRIAKAASDAMRQQHNTNKQELTELWQALRAEVQLLTEARADHAEVPSPPADSRAIVEEFDARFQWLVGELSKRFMVLGNELVRIEQRIGEIDHRIPATNGHAGQPATASDFLPS